MKWQLRTFLVLFSVVGAACAWHLFSTQREARRCRQCFEQCPRGATLDEIDRAMLRPRETLAPPPHFAAWDGEALAPEDAQRIATVVHYRVDTFYLPTIFEYDFDADGHLIGKYVYN